MQPVEFGSPPFQANYHGSETLALTVEPPEAGARLDQFLARRLGWSRARLQKLLKSGRVAVNGHIRPASYRVRAGDAVQVSVPAPAPSHLAPEALPLDIVFEDRDLLVVNKPPGLVVHPAPGHRGGTLLERPAGPLPGAHRNRRSEPPRPGAPPGQGHQRRLVVAKTALAHAALVRQFQAHEITKRYLALVWGRLPAPQGQIDKEIGRHPKERQKMTVHPRRGKAAVTLWRVVTRYSPAP